MKFLLAILGCMLAAASVAVGQAVSVELALDQEQYLLGEPLPLKVRVTNFTGQNLRLGTDETWLTFAVEDASHFVVTRQGAAPVAGEFTLEPSMTGTKKVNLTPYYDLGRIGRYFVTATVNLPQWGAIQSKPIAFDIIRGSSLWERDFGVPRNTEAVASAPEVRKYALVQTLHAKVIKLYFRLTDTTEDKIYRIYSLGQMVSFSSLEPQIDKFSNLHVLFQTGGRAFTHCLINPDGVLLGRETYEPGDTRPALRAEKDGRIRVAGGVRRLSASDLPPPSNSTLPSNAKPEQP